MIGGDDPEMGYGQDINGSGAFDGAGVRRGTVSGYRVKIYKYSDGDAEKLQ